MRVAIIGLGLIGGSAGMAFRRAGHTVAGYARRAATLRRAIELGAVDEPAETLAQAAQAEVLVLAAPVLAIRDLLADLGPLLPSGAIVTDVASTKRQVETWALQLLPAGVHFVGGHPMAGKETAGIDYADGALFRGRTWCIVPPPRASEGAVAAVAQLAADTGALTIRMTAAEHDAMVAATSHLPFTVSALLCDAVLGRQGFDRLAPVAGPGLRDLTRLASGDALMHRDICVTNRDNLVRELEYFSQRLAEVTALIRALPDAERASGDGALAALEDWFRRLKQARDAWLRGAASSAEPVPPATPAASFAEPVPPATQAPSIT